MRPIYLKDVAKDPQILMRSVREQRCCKCNVSLQETITGKRHTADGFADAAIATTRRLAKRLSSDR